MANHLNNRTEQEDVLDMRKSAVRRPSARISNKRLRSVGVIDANTRLSDQERENNNMIVTMSIEQSDEIAVETTSGSGRFAASHTRQISRTSTLYDPLGIAIEVVCGSSMENRKEVVMDVMSDLTPPKRVPSSGRTGKCLKHPKVMLKKPGALLTPKECISSPHTFELRRKLNFLSGDQFERLLRFNVQEPKDILKLTLLQLMSIGIGIGELELLIKMMTENIPREFTNQPVAANSAEVIGSVVENIDENHDDDEDKPLVIDETFAHTLDERSNKDTTEFGKPGKLRGVHELENSLGVVCNVKIPKSRIAIADIRSELSHIVADLNANEEKIMSSTQGKVQSTQQKSLCAPTSNKGSIGIGITSNQEPIITTSKQLDCNVDVNAKLKAVKPVKRARRVARTGRPTKAKAARARPLESTETNCKPKIIEVLHNTANTEAELVAVDCSPQRQLPSTQLTINTDKRKTPSTSMLVMDPINVETSQDVRQSVNIKARLPAGAIVACPSKPCYSPADISQTNISSVDNQIKTLPRAYGVFYINHNKNVIMTHDSPMASKVVVKDNRNVGDNNKSDQSLKAFVCLLPLGSVNINQTNTANTCKSNLETTDSSDDPNLSVSFKAGLVKSPPENCVLPSINGNENELTRNTATTATKNTNKKMKRATQITNSKNCKNLKSLSAALAKEELKCKQSTVLLTKLDPQSFLPAGFKKEDSVDADSTTTTAIEVDNENSNKQDGDKRMTTATAGNNMIELKLECKESEGKVTNIGKQAKLRRLSLKDVNSNQQVREQQPWKAPQYGADAKAPTNILGSNGTQSFSMCPESPKSDSVSNDFQGFENQVEATAQSEQKEIKNSQRHDETASTKHMIGLTDNSISIAKPDIMQLNRDPPILAACHLHTPSNENKIIEGSDTCGSNDESPRKVVNGNLNKNHESVTGTAAPMAVKRGQSFEESVNLNKLSPSYDCDDVDMVVSIASPLSPISNGIASPTNPKANLSDYTPAVEVDGHLSYPPMLYILYEIEMAEVTVNKPKAMDALLRSNVTDPRLMKHTRKIEIGTQPSLQSLVPSTTIQNDPRRYNNSVYNNEAYTPQHQQSSQQQTPNMLLYGCLQRSPWYQSLMSTMKIQINQTISVLVRAINNFQKMRMEDPYAVFDIFKLYCAGELLEILENLGLFVDVNGVISERKSTASFGGNTYGNSTLVNATYSFIQPVVTTPANAQATRSFPMTPSTPQTPFVSCYLDSPPVPPSTPPPTVQRRHCGLKAPYIPKAVNRSPASPVARQLRYDDSEEECWDLDEEVSTPVANSNSGYNSHHANRPYPRQDRNRDQRIGKKFSYTYRKRF